MHPILRVCPVLFPLIVACANAGVEGADATTVDPDSGVEPMGDAMGLDCSSALTGWHPLGMPLSAWSQVDSPANGPSLTVDPVTGTIYVAWLEGTPADGHVRMWDGTSWQEVGGPISVNPDSTPVYSVHVAAHAGAVILAHAEAGGATSTGFYVHSHDGDWQLQGGGDLSAESVSVTGGAARFDGFGNAIVAWSQTVQGGSGRRIQVSRLGDGAAAPLYPELGGIAGPGALAITPSVTFAADGTEVVAFSESGVRVFERSPGDASWDPLGGDSVSAIDSLNGGHSPHLTRSESGQVYLAMAEFDNGTSTSNGYLMELVGSAWQRRSGVIDVVPGEHTYVQSATVDGAGEPLVAVTEGAGANKLYILTHNGSGFLDVGTMPLSAYSGAESVNAAALATDACGRPVVAFTEADTDGERDLHVYRFYE